MGVPANRDVTSGPVVAARRRQRTLVSAGLALCVFALLALSGPGRIDVIDGQVRYEVSRSVVDYGDIAIHNPALTFTVRPGRNGKVYSAYRFPQSLLGVPAVLAADATGPRSEARRHFFFILTTAAAGALLALVYLAWFRRDGLPESRALLWAAAGIVCTPNWFYGTTTFDDLLGSLAVVAALVVAGARRARGARWTPMWTGLLLGLAFNCKPPLAVFALVAVALADGTSDPAWRRVARASVILAGLVVGVAVYVAFDLYKFPLSVRAAHGASQEGVPMWPGQPLVALLALAVSPGTGVFWYSPTLPLCVRGIREWTRANRRLLAGIGGSVVLFVGFIASISYFKGDLAWGPRYLTPVFAVLWLFAARAVKRWRRPVVVTVLVVGACVQVLAVSVVPGRLYLERRLPLAYGVMPGILYFDPANSNLVQRPREIVEIWAARAEHTPFSPMADPTAAGFLNTPAGPDLIPRYKVLNSFRPWWASQVYLPPAERPVSIASAALALLALAAAGAAMVALGLRREGVR